MSQKQRNVMVAFGIAIPFLALLLVWLSSAPGSIGWAKTRTDELACKINLHSVVGIVSLYLSEDRRRRVETMDDLVRVFSEEMETGGGDSISKTLKCALDKSNDRYSYEVVGRFDADESPKSPWPVLRETRPNHDRRRHVAFSDGHVDLVSE